MVLLFCNNTISHLEQYYNSFVRATFIEFSSAFNSIQPHLLIDKLLLLGVNCKLVLWILNYLRDRPQFVQLKGLSSDKRSLSTGAPQG